MIGQIEKLYENLPKNSMAKHADNPGIFEEFRKGIGIFGSLEGYAILCRDRDTEGFTWHIHCDEYGLDEFKNQWAREASIEPRIRQIRHGRNLKCLEVVTKFGEHYFLDSESKGEEQI